MDIRFDFEGTYQDFVREMERAFTPEFRGGALLTVQITSSGFPPIREVVIESVGTTKIEVIKTVRAFLRLGLKEAKALIEQPMPVVLVADASPTRAEQFCRALRDAGAEAVTR